MQDPDHRSAGASRLVALLDLVERPAAAVSATGMLLGANRAFLDFSERIGLAGPVQIETLLAPESRAACRALLAIGSTSRAGGQDGRMTFLDGGERAIRIERASEPGDAPVLLLVADEPRPGRPAPRAESSLGHDLAGPLTAILGTAELLLVRGPDLPGEVRDSIGHILENCGRITEIIARERDAAREREKEPS